MNAGSSSNMLFQPCEHRILCMYIKHCTFCVRACFTSIYVEQLRFYLFSMYQIGFKSLLLLLFFSVDTTILQIIFSISILILFWLMCETFCVCFNFYFYLFFNNYLVIFAQKQQRNLFSISMRQCFICMQIFHSNRMHVKKKSRKIQNSTLY